MSTVRLQRDLPLYNPWWETNQPPTAADTPYREPRRSDYHYHYDFVRDERFYALVGAHRAGKTSTLYQIIHDLIVNEEAAPTNVVYVSLDNPLYGTDDDRFILDVHDWYSSYINRNASETDQPTYFLLDDAHHIAGWADQIESLLKNTTDTHFAITLPVKDDALDRFESHTEHTNSILRPPKFIDYANAEYGVPKPDKDDYIYPIRASLDSSNDVDIALVVDRCLTLQNELAETDTHPRSVVENYRFESGLRDESGEAPIKQALQLTIFRDVLEFYSIEDPGDLYTLCGLVAQTPTSEFEFSDLTELLETDRRTIRKYLAILEDFFILAHSYKWGYERHRSLRMYLIDPRFVTALNTYSDTDPDSRPDDVRRQLTEAVVYDHLRRLAFNLNHDRDIDMPVQYWDESGHTVEYVLDIQGDPLPIGLTQRRGEDAATAVTAFIDSTDDASRGIVAGEDITNPYTTDDSILRLPLWMLLYIC